MPAKAGIQGDCTSLALDPRFRRGDTQGVLARLRTPPVVCGRFASVGVFMRIAIGLALVLATAVAMGRPAPAAAPSFDCAKAGNWAEKQICGNDELAALDAWFAPLYGQVAQRLTGKDLDALKAKRKAWLKARGDCKAEADGTACLKTRYQEFTADLERQFAPLAGGGAAASVPAAKS